MRYFTALAHGGTILPMMRYRQLGTSDWRLIKPSSNLAGKAYKGVLYNCYFIQRVELEGDKIV